MKKNILNFLLIIALAPLLTQCASQTDVDDLRYQLRIVNKKLEEMKSTTFGQLQKRQAASAGQMDTFGLEILELKSQLEETGHTNRRLKEQNKELQQSITAISETEDSKREELIQQFQEGQREKEAELRQLNDQIKLQSENVKAIQDARIRDAELRAQSAKRAAKAAKAKARTASTTPLVRPGVTHIVAEKKKIKLSLPPKPTTVGTSKQIAPVATVAGGNTSSTNAAAGTPPETSGSAGKMAQAQKLFDKNKFNEAYDLFEQVATSPSSSNSVDARYMMGQCLFKQKEYDKAIMQYQKIISQHPGDKKAPAAMFRQGEAFEKLSDKETAKVIYKKILKRHGSSPEAEKAKEKLNKF